MWSELGHKCRQKPLDNGMERNSGSHHPLGAGLGVGAEEDLRPASATHCLGNHLDFSICKRGKHCNEF